MPCAVHAVDIASGCTPGTVNSGWPQSVSSQATSAQTFSRAFRSSLPKVDFPVPLLPHTAAVAWALSPALASCMAALIPEAACMSTRKSPTQQDQHMQPAAACQRLTLQSQCCGTQLLWQRPSAQHLPCARLRSSKRQPAGKAQHLQSIPAALKRVLQCLLNHLESSKNMLPHPGLLQTLAS